jgi:hypothetical protein
MPYEFREWEREPEARPSSGRAGIPPRKFIGAGVLEPPVPPKRPIGRLLAGVVLAAIIVSVLFLFFARR